jgi:hypothetical protein
MFNEVENSVICINKAKAPLLFEYIRKKNFTLDCSYFDEKETYIDNTDYFYEDTNIPSNSITAQVEATEKIKKEEPCSPEDFFKGKCGIENENTDKVISVEQKDNMINNIIGDIMNKNLNNILDNILEGKKDDYIIQQDDISYQLTTTENQINNKYNNISTINLGECETILKNIYTIDNSSSLIILKVDYKMEELKIPIIGYEVFHPETKEKLNLSYCSNVTVDYNIPVNIDEKDLDKYNTSSDYYNDDCSVYTTEDGTDIIILDRKKEFNENNMSLCENNCNYTSYNSTTKNSVCMCAVKSKIFSISDIIDNKESLSQSFNISDSSTSSSNLKLMTCIDTLFSKYGLLKNLEFYILIIMTILYVISGVLYYRIGSYLIENDIKEILDEKYENDAKIKRKKKSKSKSSKKNINISKVKISENLVSNPIQKKRKKTKIKEPINSTIKKVSKINHQKSLSKLEINNPIDYPEENTAPIKKNFRDYEINTLSYKEALLYDKRTLMEYYISLIKTKHPLIFHFIPMKDHNSIIIKIDLFIIHFAICSAVNCLFFTENTIHKIYGDKGTYKIGFYLPKIIISFLISHVISIGLRYLFLSQYGILEIKKKTSYDEESDKADGVKRCLTIKYIIFYIAGTAFLILFWFYLSSFCAVYQNTQIFLIINTLAGLFISFLYPIIINFLPAFLRYFSLSNDNNQYLYKISCIIQII